MRLTLKYLSAIISVAVMAACGGNEPQEPASPPPPEPKDLELTSFKFRKEVNVYTLDEDIECVIDGEGIMADIRGKYDLDITALKPSFEGVFDGVWVGEREQVSEASAQDFTGHVTYTLKDGCGNSRTYNVFIRTGSGLPVVNIRTDNGQRITSTSVFEEGDITITNIPDLGGRFEDRMRIRVRGNATSGYEKKPYRIKLGSEAPLMGFPAHRDWILLAEYCDKSLLRTSYMWELSKIAGMAWTCRARHVDLYLDGWYAGVYLLCENVTRGEGRADISADGFIIENDGYWYREPVWFRTDRGLYYTFKYPDGDNDIVAGDSAYNYISYFMNAMEEALYSDGFADPVNGYRKYLDAVSFARWYLVQEVLGNIDTNPYFVLKDRGGKLEMYPPWDAEWSLGLAANGGGGDYGWVFPPHTSPVEKLYWKDNGYFARLTADPWFCDLLRTEWAAMKTRLPELEASVGAIADDIKYAQAANFDRWNILGRYVAVGLVAFDTWQEEVDYAAGFLAQRARWFDSRIADFPN